MVVTGAGLARVLIALLAIPVFAQTRPADRKQVGFVLSQHGDWLADGRLLHVGQAVLASSVVSLSPRTRLDAQEEWRLTIILLDNTPIPRACTTIEACQVPFTLPASLNKPVSQWARMVDAFSLIFQRVERYVPTMARAGTNGPSLPDGVAKLESGRLDLSSVFQGVPAADYLLRFQPVDPRNPRRVEMAFDWREAQQSVLTPSGLTRNLYKVSLFSRADTNTPLGAEAWILVEDVDRYQATSTAFQEVVALTRQWGRPVSETDVRTFLHACLDQLAARTADRSVR